MPVLYVYFFGFTEGGADSVFLLTPHLLDMMINFYFVMVLSFFFGSRLVGFGVVLDTNKGIFDKVSYNSNIFNFIFFVVVAVHVLFKFLLVNEGVYDSYAFDSGAMESKVWTVSMGLTELVISLFVFFLFTDNPKKAFICFLAISLNLLHGSRIFTLIGLFVYCFYFIYYVRAISGVKVLVYGCGLFFIVLISFFMVFAYRSGIKIEFGAIDFDVLISPIVYESLFNQVSFLTMLGKLEQQVVSFSPYMFVLDSIKFTLPSFFNARDTLYVSSFGNLSPLGGLSGYASAIIYFSNYSFLWYFMIGVFLSFLMRASRSKKNRLLTRFFYVYITCDTFFRLHRDPYHISMKMLINNILFIVFSLLLSYFFRSYFRRRGVS